MFALSHEFDTTIEETLDVLKDPHPDLPEARRLELVDIIDNAYLPNVQRKGYVHNITIPKGIEYGRVALLPVVRVLPFYFNAGEILLQGIDDDPELSAGNIAAIRQAAFSSGDYKLGITAKGKTQTGHYRIDNKSEESFWIAQGGTFIAVRAYKYPGRRASSAIHEATHAAINNGDPNIFFRIADIETGAWLKAMDEIECHTTQLALADRTGCNASQYEYLIGHYREKLSKYTPAAEVDTSRFVFE